MKTKSILIVTYITVLFFYGSSNICFGAEISRASVNVSGVEGNIDSNFSSISADGRFLVFSSTASNLVDGDTNNVKDIFLRDVLTGQTQRVSVDSTGQQANSDSSNAVISADGKFVAFTSNASNLVAGDTNGFPDVFIRNLALGTTTRISVSSANLQANFPSDSAAISADGTYVAFDSWASNLVSNDTNGQRDIFLRNLENGTTERISLDSSGQEVAAYSEEPAISASGRFVAFMSKGETLITGDTNGRPDIFVRDRVTGTTTRVSVDSAGAEAGNWSQGASISADGKIVAFTSRAKNLTPTDTNGTWDAFIHNRITGETRRVSVDSANLEANSYTTFATVSPDGRTVAFESPASNLVANDTNGVTDVFVYDLLSKKTVRISQDITNVEGNGTSEAPALSADGRYITFTSNATNLVPNDTNNSQDVFVYDKKLLDAKTADIALAVTSKPDSVIQGQTATYTYNVTNNGPDNADALTLINIVSRGKIMNISSSQGFCSKTVMNFCRLGTLASGANLTVTVSIKAETGNNLTQQLSVNAAPFDPEPLLNNRIEIVTPVTP